VKRLSTTDVNAGNAVKSAHNQTFAPCKHPYLANIRVLETFAPCRRGQAHKKKQARPKRPRLQTSLPAMPDDPGPAPDQASTRRNSIQIAQGLTERARPDAFRHPAMPYSALLAGPRLRAPVAALLAAFAVRVAGASFAAAPRRRRCCPRPMDLARAERDAA